MLLSRNQSDLLKAALCGGYIFLTSVRRAGGKADGVFAAVSNHTKDAEQVRDVSAYLLQDLLVWCALALIGFTQIQVGRRHQLAHQLDDGGLLGVTVYGAKD